MTENTENIDELIFCCSLLTIYSGRNFTKLETRPKFPNKIKKLTNANTE